MMSCELECNTAEGSNIDAINGKVYLYKHTHRIFKQFLIKMCHSSSLIRHVLKHGLVWFGLVWSHLVGLILLVWSGLVSMDFSLV